MQNDRAPSMARAKVERSLMCETVIRMHFVILARAGAEWWGTRGSTLRGLAKWVLLSAALLRRANQGRLCQGCTQIKLDLTNHLG